MIEELETLCEVQKLDTKIIENERKRAAGPQKIDEMEKRYDAKFQAVFATLRQMLETPVPPRNQLGFHAAVVRRRARK